MKNRFFTLFFSLALLTQSVNAQILTSVVPDSSEQCQKLTISITGDNTNFYQGTSFISLYQQSYVINSATSTVINSTHIEGVFYFNPDQPTGSYDVSVNNGAWGDIILPNGFTLNPPVFLPQLTSLDPDTAYKGQSVVITIMGEHTHFGINGINTLAWFTSTNGGYLNATSVTAIDSLQLVANLAISTYAPTGLYTLHVSNALDGELELPMVLEVVENGQNPEIISAEPNSAHQGEALTITVTGSETTFLQGSSVLRLYKDNIGFILPTDHNVINDTVITGYFEFSHDNNTGYYDVKIINWLLEDLVLTDGFHLFSTEDNPSLTSISPDTAYQGSTITFLITAEDTHFDMEGNSASVTLKQEYEELYSQEIRIIDSVSLEADFIFSYNNYIGLRDLIVSTTFDGTMELNNCVRIIQTEPNASIVAVVPDSAYLEDVLTLSVTGKNIVFMQGTSNLSLVQGDLTIYTPNEIIVNDTVISGVFDFLSTYPLGKYDVNIENGTAWPSMTLTDGFTLKLFDFIDETGSIALLTVYPNPGNGLLNIKRNYQVTGTFLLKVYDMKGNVLLEDSIESGESEKQIDLTSYASGIYLIKIIQDQKEQTERFIIK